MTAHMVDNSTDYQKVMSEIHNLRYLLGLLDNKKVSISPDELEVIKFFLGEIISQLKEG